MRYVVTNCDYYIALVKYEEGSHNNSLQGVVWSGLPLLFGEMKLEHSRFHKSKGAIQ